MVLTDELQKNLDQKGYAFADASMLLKKIFFASAIVIGFLFVLCVELKHGSEEIVLPWYALIIVFTTCVSIPVCNVLLGKIEYEITCLKETMQIHRLCMFLDRYGELDMENNIRWLIKIADKYCVALRRVQLYLVTGRKADWEKMAEDCNLYTGTRNLKVIWTRIFEHIKELDMLGNSGSEDLFKSQFEYEVKVCYEQMVKLQNQRIFVCKIIAYLPMFCTIIFYMIYPFVLEGVKLLNTYSEEMNALGLN